MMRKVTKRGNTYRIVGKGPFFALEYKAAGGKKFYNIQYYFTYEHAKADFDYYIAKEEK